MWKTTNTIVLIKQEKKVEKNLASPLKKILKTQLIEKVTLDIFENIFSKWVVWDPSQTRRTKRKFEKIIDFLSEFPIIRWQLTQASYLLYFPILINLCENRYDTIEKYLRNIRKKTFGAIQAAIVNQVGYVLEKSRE